MESYENAKRELKLRVTVSDPDRDFVTVQFDFGDGTQTEWSGYIASGTSVSVSKRWSNPGTYYVKARSRDKQGALSSWSDSLDIEVSNFWQRTYGGNGIDVACSICFARGGGYIVAGYTYSYGAGDSDVYLLKIDENGNKVWEKTYGRNSEDKAYSICPAPGGGYVVAGYTYPDFNINSNVYLLKIDENGDKVWEKTYGGNDFDIAYSICPANDGGFMIAGYTGSLQSGNIYLIKVDKNGNKLWERIFGRSDWGATFSIIQASGNGYVIASRVSTYGIVDYNFYLLKIDEHGNKVWEKTFGKSGSDDAYSICRANDGGYVVAGCTSSQGPGYHDVYLIKVDETGNKIWEKNYGGSDYDLAYSICPANDGGYVVLGFTLSYGSGARNVYLFKIDENGNKIWDRTFGGSNDDEAYSICQAKGGGYVLAGYTDSFGMSRDIYLIKVDANGYAPPIKGE
ncbi:MAG: PQQ-binding-like beta-propeller repeat protein [candidate division WOR-3 bacterium]